ncbi:hypothetical protein AGABI1DRAFT_42644 [Agaricus bisporus var. burnettii JB137-S8]|uniref:Uncharacterized protein n=1 Tax=Agaricus bisporus var. burnettii (strain JB137-S8 / ATCC MYA-4627 / FGSC 10392) TaxID=597362 RepID=K5XSS3_AGABU|nr:uncharacterized protein AGABI1DRAFT_42644 [Agaricus bisporus var. burnettii JB137-S8]EKM78020.1 hypothetical protein AGABI1DRAFT_42644 [Agaricus bisporus var. burnettii JB137-S8]
MAGHSAIFGDRFSLVQAAYSSTSSGAKAQYYPLNPPHNDVYNPTRPTYAQGNIPPRSQHHYWQTIRLLHNPLNSKADLMEITKSTGISKMPLCAASQAFIHPSFFPLDPFHLFMENDAPFLWDLWTSTSFSQVDEAFHMPDEMTKTLGQHVVSGMATLPPSFCGPIRNPALKRNSQYKMFEWMGLTHWYIVPIGLELGFNYEVLEHYSEFVEIVTFAMSLNPRTEKDLEPFQRRIINFLAEFERIYIGQNAEKINRARLCIFQLIHVPVHIKWNGSVRVGSQATVERTIGEMGHKIRSKKEPFANLSTIIIDKERVRFLGLLYPSLESNSPTPSLRPRLVSDISLRSIDQVSYNLVANYLSRYPEFQIDAPQSIVFYGKLYLKNGNTLRSRAFETQGRLSQRNYRWFEALMFAQAQLGSQSIQLVIYRPLVMVSSKLCTLRGQWGAQSQIEITPIEGIVDIVGIWESKSSDWVYILRKHPGLEHLNQEEKGQEKE